MHNFYMLLIPSIPIKPLIALFLMANPDFQECVFESTEFIRKGKQDLQIKSFGGSIDE
jgi:hypothetical protein